MKFRIFILVMIFLAGCKTHESLITPKDLCEHLKEKQDPEKLRDKHDLCLDMKKEKLIRDSFCKDLCAEHCNETGLRYTNSWTDFSGCHCKCSEKPEIPR